MAFVNAGAILTAIRDVLLDGEGSVRTISADRYQGDLYEALNRNEQSRRALVAPRVEPRILSIDRHPASPSQPGNIGIYRIQVQVRLVRHVDVSHELDDDTRDTAMGLAAQDADVLRQALGWLGNLDQTSGGTLTGLVSGRLVHQSSNVGRLEPPGEDGGGIVETVHTFRGDVKVTMATS